MATNQGPGQRWPIDVYSLPHMRTRPSFVELTAAIETLNVKPSSWNSRMANQPLSEKDQKMCARYLSGIISSDLLWIPNESQRERILEMASTCLSRRCGRTAVGDITRTWNLWPGLSLVIHEPALTGDNLGLKTWASSYLLAKRLESIGNDHPLHLPPKNMFPFAVLELGSGTGLVGLAAAAIWKCRVLLSDLPGILPNLSYNIKLNQSTLASSGGLAVASALDWSDSPTRSITGKFQFILAADPLYSPEHAQLLGKVIDNSLQAGSDARVVIELPYRDEATKTMACNLRTILAQRDFHLLQQGEEYGYDDWQEGSEQARVLCWWGIWSRKTPIDSVDERAPHEDSEPAKPIDIPKQA